MDLTPGTWTYKVTAVQPDGTYGWNHSVTIKDAGDAWTVTYTQEIPAGTVTYVQTLEKGTLILRKVSLNHFAKQGRPWPILINLDFTDSKVTGRSNRASGEDKPVAIPLSGPVFGDEAGFAVTVGRLSLSDGYATTLRDYDFQKEKERLWQLRVVGTDRVTVPAGTFDTYEVELTSADGGPDKTVMWFAKDTRTPIKGLSDELAGNNGGSDPGTGASSRARGRIFGTWELVR